MPLARGSVLVVQSVIWTLTWYKKRQINKGLEGSRQNPILRVVYRDGVFVFVCVFSVSLSSFLRLVLTFEPGTLVCIAFFIPFTTIVHIDLHGYISVILLKSFIFICSFLTHFRWLQAFFSILVRDLPESSSWLLMLPAELSDYYEHAPS
jgi:hypothetical protein